MKIVKGIDIEGSCGRIMSTDIFFQENRKPKPIVVYLHGFNGFKDWGNFDLIAQQFAQAGFFFCKFNFSHNGTTPAIPSEFVDLEAYGQNTYSKEIDDTLSIMEWLHEDQNAYKSEFDATKIILLGHSRGGGIAILSAARNSAVKALITWASVSECKTPWGGWSDSKLDDWKTKGVQYYENKRTGQQMPLYYSLFEDYQLNKDKLDIQSAISQLTIPILICHGERDEAVPLASAEKLNQWAKRPTLFTLPSDHVFGRSHPNLENKIPEACQEVLTRSINFLREIKI